ncbi:hypothetical protein B0T26DRAFT_700191 [Lasiosphaeria miniovina]|uniref:F-box domain-containing protein n=1 Tax=Lasiosphaeria miniovina TaxID=1954250 RepID=A0AA40ATJ4_9PEZI|nr:uncharacterized protein B0T26DRAFT_700191 [Lasiosphaeria miniovina]KAK0721749.1 hypothetical protein B0T26DRAFT_700191 [Lasiosphaeria miniovina]
MVGLLQLPNEVLAFIFDGLDAQGFSALRLTSKYAKFATLPAFIRRYFQTRYIMLSRLSLENLAEIARHPDFSPAVRTLELCTDHFVQFPELDFHITRHEGDILLAIQEGRSPAASLVGSIDDAHSSGEEEDQSPGEEGRGTDEGILSPQDSYKAPLDKVAYTSLWEEQKHIMTGLAQAYITQALISFTNIEAVVISNMHRPWGAVAHSRQTGLPPTNAINDYEEVPFVGQVLRITLTAIVTSGAALSSLAITTGLSEDAIVPDILRPSESHFQYYKNLPLSLTELTLAVSAEATRGAENRWADDLSAFIGVFQQLTQLDLIIKPVIFGPHVNRLEQLAPKLQLPNLQCLGLHLVDCSVQGIAAFIWRHKATLQSVTLVRVGVFGGISHWRSLFALIRDNLPSLEFSIEQCTARGLALLCPVEHENGEELEDCFDVGGSHEAWTTAIQAIKTR